MYTTLSLSESQLMRWWTKVASLVVLLAASAGHAVDNGVFVFDVAQCK